MNRITDFSTESATEEDTNILTFEEGAENADTFEASPEDAQIGEAIFLPANDEFDEQVAKAQEQLEELRRQQEEIERQKNDLEQLRVRQAEFQRGRVEMIENLQHALDVLDRDSLEAEQRVEQYHRAKDTFTSHLDGIAHLRPESWSREELKAELESATQLIEEAREEYRRTLDHLDALAADPITLPQLAASVAPDMGTVSDSVAAELAPVSATAAAHGFGYWLRSGLAFTLPLMVFGFFALMLVLLLG